MIPFRPHIVVVTSYMHAFTVKTAHAPQDGETVIGDETHIGPGGKGSNQAIAAARLGGTVYAIGCVGHDAFGDAALAVWREEGIDVSTVEQKAGATTGLAFIVLDDAGQNRIVVSPGANDLLAPDMIDAADATIRTANVLVAQLESRIEPVAHALKLARRHGVRTILNPAPARSLDQATLSNVDVITPNETEAATITGLPIDVHDEASCARAAAWLCERGVRHVVMTLGERGAYLYDRETAHGTYVPTIKVGAVDTTGAGDAFTGALAVALGSGQSLGAAIALANRAGAFCVTRLGVVPGLGTRADLAALC